MVAVDRSCSAARTAERSPPGQEIARLATVIGGLSAAGVGVAVVLAGA